MTEFLQTFLGAFAVFSFFGLLIFGMAKFVDLTLSYKASYRAAGWVGLVSIASFGIACLATLFAW